MTGPAQLACASVIAASTATMSAVAAGRNGRQAGGSSPPFVLGMDTDGVVVDKVEACACAAAVPPGPGPAPAVGHAHIQEAIPLAASTPQPSRQPSVRPASTCARSRS